MKRRYAIIGAGAVGGYYGALLHTAGHEVHFLLHNDFNIVRKCGMRVETGGRTLQLTDIPIYKDVRDIPPCDVACVALKTTHNHLLDHLLPPLVDNGAAVLLLQNGLHPEEDAAPYVPAERLHGGLCFICSVKAGPGHIRHMDYGAVKIGAYRPGYTPAGITPAMEVLAADLKAADIDAQLTGDLGDARWRKLVWNVPYNGLSVVLNATTAELMDAPPARQRVQTLMTEVARTAAAAGREITTDFMSKMLGDTAAMKPYYPSMKVDFDQGRPMEVESIYGDVVRFADSHSVDVPSIRTLYAELQKMDGKRSENG
jgi:2-dehydropantoate 2-reductase